MQTELDGYRYFFPAGWLLGIWGVLLWVLFPWSLVQYPGFSHPEIMTGGFFLCFVCGFLMTAAPRFTKSFGPTHGEHKTAIALLALLFMSLPMGKKIYFLSVVVALFVFLFCYLLRRFRARKSNPPDAFLFVGVGVVSGFLGSVGLLSAEVFNLDAKLYNLARIFFLQTYILCLVLGVGSRLIPALLGQAPLPTEANNPRPHLKIFIAAAVLFIVSYFLEIFVEGVSGHILRTLVIAYLAFAFWKLHKLPARKTAQSYLLWSSAWFVLLGQGAMIFFPGSRVHILHVILVSGLGLMTFMIATRVGLSHGNHDMTLEKNSKVLWLAGGLMAMAGLTRLSAGFAPAIYQSHLLYASLTWTLALLLWGGLMIPKLIRTK